MFPKRQYGKKGWWDDNRFIAFVLIMFAGLILFTIGSVVKSGCNKISATCSSYKANAPQREQARKDKELMELIKKAKIQAQIQIAEEKLPKYEVAKKTVTVAKSPTIKKKTKSKDGPFKAIFNPSHPTFEEYLETEVTVWKYSDFPHLSHEKVDEFNRQDQADALVEWELEYGDLMFHADGTLRDSNPANDTSASGEYWVLALTLYLVFFMWSGIGTKGNVMAMMIINLIGLIAAIIMWFTL